MPDALPHDTSDLELVARLRAGDADAFDTIFRRWYPAIVRAAQKIVRDEAVAEELAQEIFLGLWRRRESIDLQGTPQSYLFQSVRNRALNHLRHSAVQRRGAEVIPLHAPEPPAADANADVHDLAEAYARAREELPPRCREVFDLSRERGLRYAEIAELLGISVKAVEANMGRALKHFRLKLKAWMDVG